MPYLSLPNTIATVSLTNVSLSKALRRVPAGRSLQKTTDKQLVFGSPPRHFQPAWSSGGRPSPGRCKADRGAVCTRLLTEYDTFRSAASTNVLLQAKKSALVQGLRGKLQMGSRGV
ncbi:hypothetical protein WJX74_011022 [Apatococcus lobatus]|uniref:Uncharacterized protein n=1 Tax=Apatococcus lobatus TaxID=904363 RepID=A0AAW1S767_9CHLO